MRRNKNRKRTVDKKDEYTRDLEAKLDQAIIDRDALDKQAADLSRVVEYFANKLGPDHVWVVEARGFLEDGQ
jgi:hypothetical protein